MEIRKLISDILDGETRTVSFDNVAYGPDGDITVGALTALNFARLAFAAERANPVLSKLLTLLCSRKTVESTLAICREWRSAVHLQVEEVYRIPLFEVSLKPVSTDYDLPNAEGVTSSLENLRAFNSSAALLITRRPDVITCLRLQASAQEVFVLFNPRVTSEHKRVASVTFSTSLPQIAQQLCDASFTDKNHVTQEGHDQELKSHEKCAGHVFVPRATAHDALAGEDSLIVSSLTLLALKADLEKVTRDNGILKGEKQRLEKSVIDLGSQLEEEKAKTRRAPPSKPPATRTPTPRGPSVARRPRPTQSSNSTIKRGNLRDIDEELDPSVKLALQLQATFDSENYSLLRQRHELMQTAQRQHHCGVCLDDFPEDDAVRIDVCGHEICRDCMRGHVCSKIEEHRFPVLCPVCMADNKNQNPGTISGALVQLLGVSEKQWETWIEMELAQFSVLFTCRKCRHSAFVDRHDLEAEAEINCPFPACDHVWCKKCQQTIDKSGPEHSCDGTSELDHLVRQQGWRYCPNCKTPIQKTHGCNHLSCIAPGCNTHFCYRCGETINRTAIPREIQEGKTAHFRSCSIF